MSFVAGPFRYTLASARQGVLIFFPPPLLNTVCLMSVSADEVRRIAELARLRLTEEEVSAMQSQMSRILDYMDKLNEIDTTGVPPMSHVLDLVNVLRADHLESRISREEGLKNAPDTDGTYFRVPKVID